MTTDASPGTTVAANTTSDVRCSFCHKSRSEVKVVVAGDGVYICDECVGLCATIVANRLAEK